MTLRARTRKMRGIFRAGRYAIVYALTRSGSTLRPCTQNLLPASVLRRMFAQPKTTRQGVHGALSQHSGRIFDENSSDV